MNNVIMFLPSECKSLIDYIKEEDLDILYNVKTPNEGILANIDYMFGFCNEIHTVTLNIEYNYDYAMKELVLYYKGNLVNSIERISVDFLKEIKTDMLLNWIESELNIFFIKNSVDKLESA